MNVIKLSAIPSTNTFLKELSVNQKIENFTVVVAENQVEGKGQRGNVWVSESGKNLTFSVYLNDFDFQRYGYYLLNVLVPVAVVEALQKFQIENLNIKWPNDILAENKKIGGILIENTFKSQTEIASVIGIGLNVNQKIFDNLPQASSLSVLSGKYFEKDEILYAIVNSIKRNLENLSNKQSELIWKSYHKLLFRKDKPSTFVGENNQQFVAIIRKVTDTGLLQLELEDAVLKNFEMKQIRLLY